MRKHKKSITSVVATLVIVLMLILSQPASSLLVSLQGPDQGITDQTVHLVGEIEIHSAFGEWANISEVRLNVTKGSQTDSVQIPVNLTPGAVVLNNYGLSNTQSQIVNVTVNPATNAVFGYGFGYGYYDYGYGYYGSQGWAFGYGYGYGYGDYSGTYGYNMTNSPSNASIVYDIFWKPTAEGSYNIELTVKVMDRDNNVREFTSQHSISIQQGQPQDNSPPVVGDQFSQTGLFTAPATGSDVWGNVTLMVMAYDEQSGIAYVEFYYENETSGLVKICDATSEDDFMWTGYWNTSGLEDGRYNLTAVGYNNASLNSSATIWVTLDNDRLVPSISSDSVQTFANQPVTFYANYTHYGIPIDNSTYGGSCNLSVNLQTFSGEQQLSAVSYSAQMSYNSTSQLYEYVNISGFPTWGRVTYNITCNNTAGFQNESKSNSSWITYYRSRSGHIYNLNTGSAVSNAVIEISQEIMVENGPSVTGWTLTTTSNSTGYYEIVFNGTESPMSSVYTVRVRDQSNTLTSPVLPPMPGPFPHEPNQTGVNLFLVPAANLTINAYNETGDVSFNAEIFDSAAGMSIETLQNIEGNYSLLVPAGRDYDVVVYRTGIYGTPPVSTPVTNATGNEYVNVSLAVSENTISGALSGVDNADYYNVTAYIGIGSFFVKDFNAARNVQANATTNTYSLNLTGTGSGVTYIIVAYAKNSTGYYSGSKIINVTTGNLQNQNITLYPLYGTYRTGGHVSTNKTRFVFQDSYGNNITGLHVSVNISEPGGYRRYEESAQSVNYVDIPIVQGSNITLNVFSPQAPPRKKVYNSSQLAVNDTITITLPRMEFKDPLSDSPLQNVSLKFIKTTSACDTPYPSSSCTLYEITNATNFDPMKAMMAGTISIRTEQQNGMVVEFLSVDLINSGPPDAHFSPNATEEITSGNTFAEVWQVGSFAPEIYDHVLIGIPYDQSELSENDPVSIKFRYLYDDDMNVIWNVSTDSVSDVIGLGYGDYNQSYFSTGITCSDTYSTLDSAGECYRNKTDNMIWFTIPHFSGGAPQIVGSIPGEEEEETTTTTSGGGGGGGGGGVLPPPLTAPSEIVESLVKYLKANEAKIIAVPSTIMEEVGLTEIEAILDKTMSVSATISKVASLPSDIPSPRGEAFTFFEIVFTQYGTQSTVEPSGYIKQRIPREWLNSVNAGSSDVKFLKYKDGKWVELTSEVIDEDSDFVYYKVNLDSFSLFAVVVEKVTKPTIPYIPPQKTPEPPGALGTPEVTPTVSVTTPEVKEEGFPLHYAAGGLLIAIAAIVIVIILKRRE